MRLFFQWIDPFGLSGDGAAEPTKHKGNDPTYSIGGEPWGDGGTDLPEAPVGDFPEVGVHLGDGTGGPGSGPGGLGGLGGSGSGPGGLGGLGGLGSGPGTGGGGGAGGWGVGDLGSLPFASVGSGGGRGEHGGGGVRSKGGGAGQGNAPEGVKLGSLFDYGHLRKKLTQAGQVHADTLSSLNDFGNAMNWYGVGAAGLVGAPVIGYFGLVGWNAYLVNPPFWTTVTSTVVAGVAGYGNPSEVPTNRAEWTGQIIEWTWDGTNWILKKRDR